MATQWEGGGPVPCGYIRPTGGRANRSRKIRKFFRSAARRLRPSAALRTTRPGWSFTRVVQHSRHRALIARETKGPRHPASMP